MAGHSRTSALHLGPGLLNPSLHMPHRAAAALPPCRTFHPNTAAAAAVPPAQTVLGSAKMVLQTGKHPGALKDMVTSPAGAPAGPAAPAAPCTARSGARGRAGRGAASRRCPRAPGCTPAAPPPGAPPPLPTHPHPTPPPTWSSPAAHPPRPARHHHRGRARAGARGHAGRLHQRRVRGHAARRRAGQAGLEVRARGLETSGRVSQLADFRPVERRAQAARRAAERPPASARGASLGFPTLHLLCLPSSPLAPYRRSSDPREQSSYL